MAKRHEPTKEVRAYLRRRKVNPEDVPSAVIGVLNSFTADELRSLNRLGKVLVDSLEKKQVDDELIIAMVH